MPSQSAHAEVRLNHMTAAFTGAVDTLTVLSESFKAPFLEAIANTAQSLLAAVQTVKRNQMDCIQLMEQTYHLLYAVLSLYIKSESGPDLPPRMLDHLGKFTETLHKIHKYVEAQQDRHKIRHFFRQSEIGVLLSNCNAGLQEALDAFKLEDLKLFENVTEMQKYTEERHQEAIELINTLSDSGSDAASSTPILRLLQQLNLNFHVAI
ncbi:hypothetical protein C8R43DRAFT_1229266 [Mycena crocata]|nr:hypothetical protein C8R43DRAFT_1229266 [Mycena crocata]